MVVSTYELQAAFPSREVTTHCTYTSSSVHTGARLYANQVMHGFRPYPQSANKLLHEQIDTDFDMTMSSI